MIHGISPEKDRPSFGVSVWSGFLACVPYGILVTAGGTRFHEIVALDAASEPSTSILFTVPRPNERVLLFGARSR